MDGFRASVSFIVPANANNKKSANVLIRIVIFLADAMFRVHALSRKAARLRYRAFCCEAEQREQTPGPPYRSIMPLTKQYLRYEHSATFGVVCSQRSNAVLLEKRSGTKGASALRAVVPALEDVYAWDLRTSRRVCTLKGNKREVTSLAVGADGKTVAVGHEDGAVVLWDVDAQASHVTLR